MAVNPLLVGGGIVTTAAVVGGGLYAGGVFNSSKDKELKEDSPNAKTENKAPNWIPASEDDNANGLYTTPKYANKYQKYLVGVNPKNVNTTTRSNDAWWDWTFENIFKSKEGKKGKFSSVTSGKDGDTSLKSVCGAAYKEEIGNDKKIIAEAPESIDNEKYRESDVWAFCSSGGTKIKTISENNGEETSYNSTSDSYGTTKKTELVSATDEGSNWFWDLKTKDLKNETNFTSESFFKKLKAVIEKTATVADGEKSTLKETCQAAYSQATTNSNYPKAEVGKFCSLSGQLS